MKQNVLNNIFREICKGKGEKVRCGVAWKSDEGSANNVSLHTCKSAGVVKSAVKQVYIETLDYCFFSSVCHLHSLSALKVARTVCDIIFVS